MKDRTDLLALQARQLEIQDKDLEEALARKRQVREEGKEAFDTTHNVHYKLLQSRDIILWYNKVVNNIDMSLCTKLNYHWLGPYHIHLVNLVGLFKLEKLDSIVLGKLFTRS